MTENYLRVKNEWRTNKHSNYIFNFWKLKGCNKWFFTIITHHTYNSCTKESYCKNQKWKGFKNLKKGNRCVQHRLILIKILIFIVNGLILIFKSISKIEMEKITEFKKNEAEKCN